MFSIITIFSEVLWTMSIHSPSIYQAPSLNFVKIDGLYNAIHGRYEVTVNDAF